MSLPTHWREVIKVTAEELKLPELEVKTIVLFYWKYFKKEMGDLRQTKVTMYGLGTFYIKPHKVLRKIEGLKTRMRKSRTLKGIKKLKIYKAQQEELGALKAIYVAISGEETRKKSIRKKQGKMREKYYPTYLQSLETNEEHQKIKSDLGQQRKNSGRDLVHLVPE